MLVFHAESDIMEAKLDLASKLAKLAIRLTNARPAFATLGSGASFFLAPFQAAIVIELPATF